LDAGENIVALLSALGIKGDPERFFDRSLPAERWVSRKYLVFSSGIHSCLIRDAPAESNPRIVLARLPAIVTKDILAWEKICWT
jgi:LPS sulfotransferase NodH